MIQLHNVDCIDFIQTLPAGSIDVICIDPPYLYLKNQKLERPFDERLFFSECKRVLTDKGFIVMFGRGVSFYRWNCLLDELGMTFKEEIVWDKKLTTSPMTAISRMHESVSIFGFGGGINDVRVEYIEQRKFEIEQIGNDLKKVVSALNDPKQLLNLKTFIQSGNIPEGQVKPSNFQTTITGGISHRCRSTRALQTISDGMKEKSIIQIPRDHYSTIHPTQKPVRLIERLLALVIPDKPRNEIVVADFFAGSMSCMEAVYNMGMNGIACEIDEEYFEAGKKRIDSLLSKPKQSELF